MELLSKFDVKAKMAQISPKFENRRRSSDTTFQLSERKLKTWKSVKCLPSCRWESAKSRRAIQKSHRKRTYEAIPRQRIGQCSTSKRNELLSELSDTTYYNYCKPFFGEGVYCQQFVISIFFWGDVIDMITQLESLASMRNFEKLRDNTG